MIVNFKIIELEDRQVLITKDFEDDEDSIPLMNVIFFIETMKVNLKFSFHEEDKRDIAFENANAEYARKQVDDILKQFE